MGNTLNSFAVQTETFKSFSCTSARNVLIDFVWQIALLVLFSLSENLRTIHVYPALSSLSFPNVCLYPREGNPLIIQIYLSLPIISATTAERVCVWKRERESIATCACVFNKSRGWKSTAAARKIDRHRGKTGFKFRCVCCFASMAARRSRASKRSHANRIDPALLIH